MLHLPLLLRACYMTHPIHLKTRNHKFDSSINTCYLRSGSDRCHYPEVFRGCPQPLSRKCGTSTLYEAKDASFQILSTPKSSYLTILRYIAQDAYRPCRGNKSVPAYIIPPNIFITFVGVSE
jgi:hypothetical protein